MRTPQMQLLVMRSAIHEFKSLPMVQKDLDKFIRKYRFTNICIKNKSEKEIYEAIANTLKYEEAKFPDYEKWAQIPEPCCQNCSLFYR
jgi:hypothetical protein